jgi:hypothetical protein
MGPRFRGDEMFRRVLSSDCFESICMKTLTAFALAAARVKL